MKEVFWEEGRRVRLITVKGQEGGGFTYAIELEDLFEGAKQLQVQSHDG